MTRYSTIILFLIVCSTISLISQEDVLYPQGKSKFERAGAAKMVESDESFFALGFEPGVNINMYSETIDWYIPKPSSIYDTYETGLGLGLHFGLFGDINLNEEMGLNFRLSYDDRTIGGSGDGAVLSYANTPVPMELEWESTPQYLNFSLLFRYNLSDEWFITVGPTIDYFSGGEIEITPTATDGTPLSLVGFIPYFNVLTNSATLKYDIDAYNLLNAYTGQTFDLQENVRLGLEFAISYKYKITPSFSVVPTARIQYFATPAFNNESVPLVYQDLSYDIIAQHKDRMLNSIQLGIGFWYHF